MKGYSEEQGLVWGYKVNLKRTYDQKGKKEKEKHPSVERISKINQETKSD